MQHPQFIASTSIEQATESHDVSLAAQPVALELDVLSQVSGAGPYGGWSSSIVTPSGPYGGWH